MYGSRHRDAIGNDIQILSLLEMPERKFGINNGKLAGEGPIPMEKKIIFLKEKGPATSPSKEKDRRCLKPHLLQQESHALLVGHAINFFSFPPHSYLKFKASWKYVGQEVIKTKNNTRRSAAPIVS